MFIFPLYFLQATIQPFVQQLSEFRVSHGASPFDRRVTAMEWHPTHPTMLAVGSKGGDLMLWDYSKGQDGWNVVQGVSDVILSLIKLSHGCTHIEGQRGSCPLTNFQILPFKFFLTFLLKISKLLSKCAPELSI